MKIVMILSLVIVSVLVSTCFLAVAAAPPPTPALGSCEAMCKARCEKAGTHERCFHYCCLCCDKCKCVPSGTYGNRAECPCYRDWLNSKGTSKCP